MRLESRLASLERASFEAMRLVSEMAMPLAMDASLMTDEALRRRGHLQIEGGAAGNRGTSSSTASWRA